MTGALLRTLRALLRIRDWGAFVHPEEFFKKAPADKRGEGIAFPSIISDIFVSKIYCLPEKRRSSCSNGPLRFLPACHLSYVLVANSDRGKHSRMTTSTYSVDTKSSCW